MSNSKISALPSATTPLAGTEVLPVVQGGITEQVSVANLTAGRNVSAASLSLTTTPLAESSGGTGLSALGTGVATWLGTPSSANLAAAVTDETGSGALVFGTAPTISDLTVSGTGGNVFSGTYTPTLFNTTNVSASTAELLQYSRVGEYIQICGRVQIDPTAIGAVVLGMSIPVASNFGSVRQAGGTFSGSSGEIGYIAADATNDRLTFNYTATSASNNTFYFTVGYRVI